MKRVLVLERKFLAAGGTGRSVGIIRQLYPTPETSAMVLRSLRVFQRFGEAVGGEAGYVGCGALIGVSAAMRPKLEATLVFQRALGIRAEILEPRDVARVEPRINPAGLGAVLYEPESGYGDPTSVTLGFAEAARRGGAVIEQGAEVVAIHQAGGRVTGIRTAARSWPAVSKRFLSSAMNMASTRAPARGIGFPLTATDSSWRRTW